MGILAGVWYSGIMCDRASVAWALGSVEFAGPGVGRLHAFMCSDPVKVLP